MSISDRRYNLSPVIFVTLTDGGSGHFTPLSACYHKQEQIKGLIWDSLGLELTVCEYCADQEPDPPIFIVVPFICHVFLSVIFW